MKKHVSLLLSAALLLSLFAGCATTATPARAPGGHTLETARTLDVALPFPIDGHAGPLLSNVSFSDAVMDLDKPAVLQRFGRPAERLTPDLWIYWGYHSPEAAAEAGGHDTLVVTFARGRVKLMKLVSGDVLRSHLAGTWRPRPALAQK